MPAAVTRWRARRAVGAHRLAAFGRDSVIVPPAVIHSPHRIEIGERVLIHRDAFFSVVEEHNGRRYEPRLRIGDRTSIGHGLWVSCVGQIDIGAEVLAGHNILITDTFHEYFDPETSIARQPMAEPQAVRIGDGVHLGPHVAILAGVTHRRAFLRGRQRGRHPRRARQLGGGRQPGRVIRRYDHDARTWIDVDD